MSLYENHMFHKELPMIFHLDHITNSCVSNYHENIELLYCIEGTGKIIINSVPTEMKKDSVIIINSGDIHYTIADSKVLSYYCLIIYSDFLRKFGINVEEICFSEDVTDTLGKEFFEKIITELKYKKMYYKTIITGELVSYMAYLCRNYTINRKNNKNDNMIKKGLTYIRKNYCHNISVEQVADHVGFSRFYYSRQFKQNTGMTIMEYVQLLRCRHAWDLLLEGNCSVSAAAAACGFTDLSYFTKVFKRQMGILPSEVIASQTHGNNKG